jgi:hypothetical protein
MSTVWKLYYIDFKKLQHFYGSNDIGVVDQILEKYKDEMIYDKLINLSSDFFIDYRNSLTDIALANCNSAKSIEYGYALEYLCRFFGDPVPQEQYVECYMQWLTDLEIILPIVESILPLFIPIVSDAIKIGYITHQQVEATIAQLNIYDTDEIIYPLYNKNPDKYIACCAYVSWLKEVKKEEGIISFLYY